MSETVVLLQAIQEGDSSAAEKLFPLIYHELRQLAARKISQERTGSSLQATELVHQAYVRLVDGEQVQHWDTRGHFFAAAAEAMRRILVERARRKKCMKHGGGWTRWNVDHIADTTSDDPAELLVLDEALQSLQTHDAEAYRLVMLRYFGGLGHQEAAAAMGIGRRAADRKWAVARVWLYQQMNEERDHNHLR